jgi:hypothetical protein
MSFDRSALRWVELAVLFLVLTTLHVIRADPEEQCAVSIDATT